MAKKTIKAQMKQRRDTKGNWAATNPVLLDGELGIVSDDPNLYKVGDGATTWNSLPFRGFDGTLAQELGTSPNAVISQKVVSEKLTELESNISDIGVQLGGTSGELLFSKDFTITKDGYISLDYSTQGNSVIVIKTPLVEGRTIGAYLNYSGQLAYTIDANLPLDGKEHIYSINVEKPVSQMVFGSFNYTTDNGKTISVKTTRPDSVVHTGELNLRINEVESAIDLQLNGIKAELAGTSGELLQSESFTIAKTGYISLGYNVSGECIISITTPLREGRTIGAYINNGGQLAYTIDANLPLDGKEHIYSLNIDKPVSQMVFGSFEESDFSGTIKTKTTRPDSVVHTGELNARKEFGNARVVRIASSDAIESDKAQADYVCTGTNDERIIQQAINSIRGFGTIIFSEGNYYIQSFSTYSNADRPTALFIHNELKELNLYGSERDRFNNKTIFHVDMESVGSDAVSFLLGSNNTGQNSRQVNISYINVNLSTWTKPVIAIDCQYFCACQWDNVCIQTHAWNERPAITFPSVSVGMRGFNTNNNGIGLFFKNVLIVGFGEGFQMAGEHIIMMECLAYSCHYGYTFGNFTPSMDGVWEHPITLINCSEESCDCLPLFANCGHFVNGVSQSGKGLQNITMIDHTIEIRTGSNPSRLPMQPAEELNPGKFCGQITFTGNEGYAQNSTTIKFWKDGSGHNFVTRNSTHAMGGTSELRQTYEPMFMQHYYDTDLKKELIYNGANWVDYIGNIVA